MYYPNTARGLTLVELLIAIALFSILAGIASTSWTSLVAANRHAELVNKTHRLFATGRSHAVHQKILTTICPLSAGGRCVDQWDLPVSVFPDRDNNKQPDGGEIHRTFQLSENHSVLISRTAGRGYFQFSANGMSHGSMGSLIACTRDGGTFELSYLALNIGGRLRAVHDDDGNGEILLPWGTKINCPSPPSPS